MNDLRATKLEFTRLCTLVCHTRTIEHLMEHELFDELSSSIWGGLVVLGKVLPKAFVAQDLPRNRVSKNWFRMS